MRRLHWCRGLAVAGFLQLPGEPSSGVIAPDDAVVRSAGRAWVYAQTGETDFERREIILNHPAGGGWFITNGIAPGEKIVVTGAQTLLSEEPTSRKSNWKNLFCAQPHRPIFPAPSRRHHRAGRGCARLRTLRRVANSRLDVFPEFAPPQWSSKPRRRDLSSEEAEQLVTLPVENGLNGTART